MQLAGKPCVICSEQIDGILDGLFCTRCGSRVHKKCLPKPEDTIPKDHCNYCGHSYDLLVAEIDKELNAKHKEMGDIGCGQFFGGIVILLLGVLVAVFTLGATGGTLILIPTGIFLFGLIVMLNGYKRMRGVDPDRDG